MAAGDKVRGGSASAVRHRAGLPVREVSQIKAIERVNQLRKLRNRTDLSGADRATLEELIVDLEDALGTPRVGPW